jgi:5-methylcytosine-specific restriction protein A
MPYAAPKPCSYPGCPELVRSGRCEKHPYDGHDEGSQRLYNMRAWKRRRDAQLRKEPWCVECLRANVWTPATQADHVEPHRGDVVKFLTGKLQSMCKVCHSRKTAKEVFGKNTGLQ